MTTRQFKYKLRQSIGIVPKRDKCGRFVSGTPSIGNPRHNLRKTPEYYVWRNMKSRCYNRSNPNYKNYGGRGITVCDRWLDSVETFVLDMGQRPTPKHSIDRKDNDKGYTPDNCRWATWTIQANNRRPPKSNRPRLPESHPLYQELCKHNHPRSQHSFFAKSGRIECRECNIMYKRKHRLGRFAR
jgi:hypothetical protein